jgi:hypothetical protein
MSMTMLKGGENRAVAAKGRIQVAFHQMRCECRRHKEGAERKRRDSAELEPMNEFAVPAGHDASLYVCPRFSLGPMVVLRIGVFAQTRTGGPSMCVEARLSATSAFA